MQEPTKSRPVGRLVNLWRYPVKSMAPEVLSEVEVSWFGVVGDRRWAFVRTDQPQSGFPWFMLRQKSDLRRYVPSWEDHPDQSGTSVRTPSGSTLDVTDPRLATELGEDVRVIRQDRGVFDTFPLSLITAQTVERLSEMVDIPLEVQRFRPNFLVESTTGAEFPEDEWVGHTLRIGQLRMRVDKRDGRCVVITIDPETNERSPSILKSVAQERDGCLGIYGTTVEPGTVRVGDGVFLES